MTSFPVLSAYVWFFSCTLRCKKSKLTYWANSKTRWNKEEITGCKWRISRHVSKSMQPVIFPQTIGTCQPGQWVSGNTSLIATAAWVSDAFQPTGRISHSGLFITTWGQSKVEDLTSVTSIKTWINHCLVLVRHFAIYPSCDPLRQRRNAEWLQEMSIQNIDRKTCCITGALASDPRGIEKLYIGGLWLARGQTSANSWMVGSRVATGSKLWPKRMPKTMLTRML